MSQFRASKRAAPTVPCALAIGGLDPGGGAGVLADTRAFQRVGAFGAAVVSVWTVQSTAGLERVGPVPQRDITDAIACVLANQNVRAIKTGALGDVTTLRAVLRMLVSQRKIPIVVDPVIRATTTTKAGVRLLETRAVDVVRKELFPRALLVTPNAEEAHALTGIRIANRASAEQAAREILGMGPRAVLLKGGHIAGDRVYDVLVTKNTTRVWSRMRIALPKIHGGGCTLAALITGLLAMRPGFLVSDALLELVIARARHLHARALRHAIDVGGPMRVLV